MRESAFIIKIFLCSLFVYRTDCVKWEGFMETALHATKEFFEIIEPYLTEKFPFGNVSTSCTSSLIFYADGIKNWNPWAIKMFDSTGKPPSTFLRGTHWDPGFFDECLTIKVNTIDDSDDFRGKFCMLHLNSPLFSSTRKRQNNGKSYIETYGYPPEWATETTGMMRHDLMNNFGLYLGICVPSTCSNKDLHLIFTSLIQDIEMKVSLTDCQVLEVKEWPTRSKISAAVIAGLIALVVIGTIVDILDQNGPRKKFLKAFSIRINCKLLFATNETKHPLDFVYGFKVILCIWMFIIHFVAYPTIWREKRGKNIYGFVDYAPNFLIFMDNGALNTEYIMFLSGFLISYSTHQKSLKNQDRKERLNFIYAIFLKYIRLTSVQVLLILITFVVPLIYNGPVWNSVWQDKVNKCINFGWLNLLYANNFGTFEDLCWEHTWFISAVMQLQILCLGLYFITKRHPRTGVIIGALMIIGFSIHDFNLSVKNKFNFPALYVTKSLDECKEYAEKIYIKPFHHFNVYITGMILGCLNLKDFKPKKVLTVTIWILYIISSAALFFAIKIPTKNVIIIAIHNSCRNILVCFQMGLIIFLCLTKSAGALGKLLEWKSFVPLSRMMFSVTIFHPFIIVALEAVMRERISATPTTVVWITLFLTLASYLFGFIAYLLVEAPFNRICDLLEGKETTNSLKYTMMSENDGRRYSENMKTTKKIA